jgi:hypothetical protein
VASSPGEANQPADCEVIHGPMMVGRASLAVIDRRRGCAGAMSAHSRWRPGSAARSPSVPLRSRWRPGRVATACSKAPPPHEREGR